MERLKIRQIRLSILSLFLAIACQKSDNPTVEPEDDQLHEVTFRLNHFHAGIRPLSASKHSINEHSDLDLSTQGNVIPSPDIQYLYYWSFNQEDTQPDIALNIDNASIDFTSYATIPKHSFTTGFSYESYAAGKAYNITALDALLFDMPIQHVDKLVSFAFDISSSNTGPKGFILYVSINSSEYTVLSENNQFYDTKANGRNSYVYDLTQLDASNSIKQLSFKIVAMEGERGYGSKYNDKSGTIKIDNVRLMGVYSGPVKQPVISDNGQLYYHIYSAQDSLLVLSGQTDINPSNSDDLTLDLKLKEGNYLASFAADFTSTGLKFSTFYEQASDLYWYYPFADAKTFAAKLNTLIVESDMTLDLTMERSFSQIRFEFTDIEGLDQVEKIEILALNHTAFSPFTTTQYRPINIEYIYMSEMEQDENGYYLQFDQFLGLLNDPYSVSYLISVFGEEKVLLRTFNLEASILNNVQLTFTGNLLGSTSGSTTGFAVKWKEAWKDLVIVSY